MKFKNLKRAIEHIKNIPENKFDMTSYRDWTDNNLGPECNSVGCIIGHCTSLDIKNVIENFTGKSGGILFGGWSTFFFGLKPESVTKDSYIWDYLFHGRWANNPKTNTPKHAVYRMERVLNGYQPDHLLKEIDLEEHYELTK